MKKIISILLFSWAALMAFAGPVSRQQASEIARNYLQQRVARGASQPAALTLAYECLPREARAAGVSSPLYFVFNQDGERGFLVVAGDDRMTPVLGFTDCGHFTKSEVHESLQWWLDALEETMLSVVKSKSEGPVFIRKTSDDGLQPAVAPMVKVNWGQGEPYNNMCPIDKAHDNKRSLVGCTAVAMAQILSKWESPEKGSGGYVQYTTAKHHISMRENLSTFHFDWENMLPSYAGNKGTATEKEAVARLMYACGLAVNMDYCAIASGAFGYAYHFEKHFGIDSICNNLERIYFTKSEWDALIKKELSEGRPVLYNGFSRSAGHAFVCDGYDHDGLFHINWGWDGSMNGYFALAELNSAVEYAGAPTEAEGSFNLDQSAVFGIQPKVGEGGHPSYRLCYSSLKSAVNFSRNNVRLTVVGLRADGNGFKGTFSVGVFDKENQLVGTIKNTRELTMGPGFGYDSYTINGALPDGLADGVYNLQPVCKGVGASAFEPMRGRKGSSYVNYMTMTVNGNAVKLTQPEMVDAQLSIVSVKPLNEKCYAGATNALEIVLRNDGAMYNGPIELSRTEADGEITIYDNNYIIESGEEISLRVKFAAPEGVEKDVINVWMAKTDADIVHNNGYEYGLVGNFDYELVVPAAGKPILQLKKFTINNKTAYLGEYLNIDVTMSNSGGFFGEDVYAFVFPKNGGNSLTSGKKQAYIDKGETVSFQMAVPTATLEAGEYFIQVFRLNEESQFEAISYNQYKFTVKDHGTISVSNTEGFNVFYVNHAFILPQDLTAGVVTAVDANNLNIDYRYAGGDVIPAKTPVVMQAEGRTSRTYQVVLSSETAPTDNLLSVNTDEEGMTYAGEGTYWYYKFDDDGNRANYGFYLDSPTGAPFKLKTRQCYLAVPAEQAKASGYPFLMATTGIEDILVGGSQNAVIYTLSGVRVSGDFENLPKGIYIVNGKKVMK